MEILKCALPTPRVIETFQIEKKLLQSLYLFNYIESGYTAIALYLFSWHFVLLKEHKRLCASSLNYYLRRRQKAGRPTLESCFSETQPGKGEGWGVAICYIQQRNHSTIITPRKTEGTLMRQTQKGIREVRLDVHLQVLNLLLRFPWGLSPEYITTALLSSRESLSLPQPLFSACLLRLCRKPNRQRITVSK